jgi:phage head maturation protease
MTGIEYRSVPASHVGLVDDMDDHRVRVVFPANVTDRHGTQFAPMWAADSLRRNPHPPMLFSHDPNDPIGVTVQHQIIPDGPRPRLEVVNRFDSFDANPSAKRAHHGIASGSLAGFSYGFTSGEHVAHRSLRGVRVYTRATLKETSPCALPSIPGAKAVALRGLDYFDAADDITGALDTLDRLCSTGEARKWIAGHDEYEAENDEMAELLAKARLDKMSIVGRLR